MNEQDVRIRLGADEIRELRDRHYNATIIRRENIHEDLIRLQIRPDAPIPPFHPGQYVALGVGNWERRLPGTQTETLKPDRYQKLVRRAYSISCPMWSGSRILTVGDVDYLEFYIVLVRQSPSPDDTPPALTPRLFAMHEGDRMVVEKKITGQYHLGNVRPDDTLLMMGTGTGEAPHNAMAAELLSRNHAGKIVNATCVRHKVDLGYLDIHRVLMSRFANYVYLPLTTRDPENIDPSHPEYCGKMYLQELFQSGRLAEMAGDDFLPSRTRIFLCGNPAMIGYVPPGADPPRQPGMLPLLRAAGFIDDDHSGDAGRVRFEKYW